MSHNSAPNVWTYSAGVTARAGVVTPVLVFRPQAGRTGWVRPRPLTVRVLSWASEVQTDFGAFAGDFVRVRYQIGRQTLSADLDVAAGASMCSLIADAVDVSFFNGDPNAADRWVTATVSRGVLSDADARVARRSSTLQVPAVPVNVKVPIPQGATQCQLTAPPGAWSLSWLDAAGNSPSAFTYSAALSSNFSRVDVPGGAHALQINTNPTGAPADVQLTWRTPL